MFGLSAIFHRSSCVLIEYVSSLSRPSHDKIQLQVCTAYPESPKCPHCISCVCVSLSKSCCVFNTTLGRDRRTRDAVQTHSSYAFTCVPFVLRCSQSTKCTTCPCPILVSVRSHEVCFKNSPKQTWWLAWRSTEIVCVPISSYQHVPIRPHTILGVPTTL